MEKGRQFQFRLVSAQGEGAVIDRGISWYYFGNYIVLFIFLGGLWCSPHSGFEHE